MSTKEKAITIRIPEEKWAELCELARKTGIGAASIGRSGLYQRMEELKREAA